MPGDAGRAVIDRYLLPAGLTAANPPHAAAAGEWHRRTERGTDKRTSYRYIDPAPHTMREVPKTCLTEENYFTLSTHCSEIFQTAYVTVVFKDVSNIIVYLLNADSGR